MAQWAKWWKKIYSQPLFAKIYESDQIDYKFASEVMEHKQEKGFISVTLRNGNKLNTRLVVGADGKNSELARRAGIKKTGWRYNQTALVCAIEHEIEHNGLAWQYFYLMDPSLFCQ